MLMIPPSARATLQRWFPAIPGTFVPAPVSDVPEGGSHLAGDLHVFTRLDHEDPDPGAGRADVGVGAGHGVGGLVEGYPEESEARGGPEPDGGGPFADAGGEHQRVE